MRFADARWSYGGPKYDEMNACKGRMFEAVAAAHDVESDDVARAAERLGDNRLEWAVHAPLTAFYLIASLGMVLLARRRFDHDERAMFLLVAVVTSLAASVALVMIGTIWAGIVEMLRVGNQHLAFRGTRLPWHQQYVQVFAAALMIFWVIVLLTQSATARQGPATAAPTE